jgi:sulfide:quinone oxidoreductase
VVEVHPDRAEVRTAGETFPYDYLVVASGAELDYAAVPGIGPDAHTQSTFTTAEAVAARDALARTLQLDRGRIVIGAAPGASCIGPAYEIAMQIDTALRRARGRHRFHVEFVTPEPFVGHFGVGGIGKSGRMFEDEFAERHIDGIVNVSIVEARSDRLVLADGTEHVFDFSLVIPAFLGSPFVRGAAGLANPRGFVTVTPELRSTKFENIYAVGVAIAIAPPAPTPVPVAVPKTGGMTDLMAQAAAHNIAADIVGGSKIDGLTLAASCIADAGDTAFWLRADPFLPPRNRVQHKRGKWAHYLKAAFYDRSRGAIAPFFGAGGTPPGRTAGAGPAARLAGGADELVPVADDARIAVLAHAAELEPHRIADRDLLGSAVHDLRRGPDPVRELHDPDRVRRLIGETARRHPDHGEGLDRAVERQGHLVEHPAPAAATDQARGEEDLPALGALGRLVAVALRDLSPVAW